MAVDSSIMTVVTVLYLIVILLLAYIGYCKTKKAEDYMVAGRRINPLVLALSYGATFISTSAIVGFGGTAAYLGMGLLWLTVLNIGIGILIAFVVFGKKTREIGHRLNAVTFPDLLGKCYNSSFLRDASAVIIMIGMPLYTAAILIGGARFIETTLNMSYNTALIGFAVIVAAYVIIGGLIAVMYTDALQGSLMAIGMTILLVLTYVKLGGISAAHESLSMLSGNVSEGLRAAGHTGWISMPTMGSSIWYTLVTTIVLGVGIGVLAQPQLIVRFMTVKSDRSLNRAVLVGGPFILLMTGVAFTVGALTNVYFYNSTGEMSLAAAGGNIDSIIPTYINSAMPDIFIVIFMLVLLSAAMSTLSSLFHTMGTAVGHDLLNRGGDTKNSLMKSQMATVIMIVASVLVAYVLPGGIIARATAMFMGLCASALLPSFVMALYSKRPSKLAAKASLVTGAAIWFAWTAFVHVKEAEPLGISQAIFGKSALLEFPWVVVDPLVLALPLSTLVLVGIWIIEKRTPATQASEDVAVPALALEEEI